MKKFLVLLAFSFLMMVNSYAQIKVSSEIINKTTFFDDEIELKLRFENVPCNNITGAVFQTINFNFEGIREWKKLSDNTFETEVILKLKNLPKRAYLYVYRIHMNDGKQMKFLNVEDVAFIFDQETLEGEITNQIPLKGVIKKSK